jgi:RNA-directed DNA polymerase
MLNIYQYWVILSKFKWTVDNKYFTSIEYDNWIFNAGTKIVNGYHKLIALFKLHTTKIVRHVKIRADANPYDPAYAEYYRKRKLSKSNFKQHAFVI